MKIHKTLKPVTKPYDGNRQVLVKDFKYEYYTNCLLYIEEGFIFDGASIPKFAKSFISGSFDPEYIGPALIHDFLYRNHLNLSRKAVDKIFRDTLKKNGVGIFRRNLMYQAVRVGGRAFWRKGK